MPGIPPKRKPRVIEDRASLRARATFNDTVLDALEEAGEARLSRIAGMWQGYHASAQYVPPAERRAILDVIETAAHEHRQHIVSRRHFIRHTIAIARKAERQGIDVARASKALTRDLSSLRKQDRQLNEMLKRVGHHRKNQPSASHFP